MLLTITVLSHILLTIVTVTSNCCYYNKPYCCKLVLFLYSIRGSLLFVHAMELLRFTYAGTRALRVRDGKASLALKIQLP